jgi:hypothetical protein
MEITTTTEITTTMETKVNKRMITQKMMKDASFADQKHTN